GASEIEFYVFEDCDPRTSGGQLIPVDRSGYFDVQGARADKLCRVAVDALTSFGVQVEATHGEVGPGQHEIDIAELGALEAADAIVATKWTLRSLARRENLLVTFMPKPVDNAPGSGLHISQVLTDKDGGADAF